MPATHGRAATRAVRHVVLLACAGLTFAATSAAAAVPADFYGVNSGSGVFANAALRETTFRAMRAGGLSYVRVDASWGSIEPSAPVAGAHVYVWAGSDAFVTDLARSGLRWYPALGYSAAWASSVAGDAFAPPVGDGDYAAFVAAFAARYGSAGSFWAAHPELPRLPVTVYGIWNEPSNPRFWRGADASPGRYMSLYLAGRAAIRSADPAARVATAGLLDSGVVDGAAYLRAMLDSVPGARNQIDALGWHPYVSDVDQVLASVRSARATLDAYGLGGVPIEISEIGMHTGYSQQVRAQWLHDVAMKLPSAGLEVTRLMPYVWSGDATWQITDPDGSLGPVGTAFLAGIRDAATYEWPAAAAGEQRGLTVKRAVTKACKPLKKTATSKARSATTRAARRCAAAASKRARAARVRARARAARARSAKARAARARARYSTASSA